MEVEEIHAHRAFSLQNTKQCVVLNLEVNKFNPSFICGEYGPEVEVPIFQRFFGSKFSTDAKTAAVVVTSNINERNHSVGWLDLSFEISTTNCATGTFADPPHIVEGSVGTAIIVAKVGDESLLLLTAGHNVGNSKFEYEYEVDVTEKVDPKNADSKEAKVDPKNADSKEAKVDPKNTDINPPEVVVLKRERNSNFHKGNFCIGIRSNRRLSTWPLTEFEVKARYVSHIHVPDPATNNKSLGLTNDIAVLKVNKVPKEVMVNAQPIFPIFPEKNELIGCIGHPGKSAFMMNVFSQVSASDYQKVFANDSTMKSLMAADDPQESLDVSSLFHGFGKRVVSIGEMTHGNAQISTHTSSTIGGFSGGPVFSLTECPRSFYGVNTSAGEGESFAQLNRNVFLSTYNKSFQKIYQDNVLPHISAKDWEDLRKADPQTAEKFRQFETYVNSQDYSGVEAYQKYN